MDDLMPNGFIKYWYTHHPLLYLLLPFSWIYQLIVTIRHWLYQKKIFKVYHFNVPVIVVGNITVGGTGKTPLVAYLAQHLQQRGYRPGIVSRGYGGKTKEFPQLVTINSDPTWVGDETVLLAQLAKCPVAIAPKRPLAVQMLIEQQRCNIIISDDGLQHYALARNIEIAVIDGMRGLGNGVCLPAGPLREPVSRLQRVDRIVINGTSTDRQYAHLQAITMQLLPGLIYNLKNTTLKLEFAKWQQRTVHAVAGIGNPSRFFQQLHALGLTIIEHPFPDHHPYVVTDFAFAGEDSLIIMTEKDAVKCRRFADERFWVLPVTVDINEEFMAGLYGMEVFK